MKDFKQRDEEYKKLTEELKKGKIKPSADLMFRGYALDAVDYLRQLSIAMDPAKPIVLDFSEASIQTVEEFLDQLNKALEKEKPDEERIVLLAKSFAGYIGEVIREKWGGKWVDNPPLDNGPAFTVDDDEYLYLLSKVYRRIKNGSEDNVWFFYQVTFNKRKTKF